EHSNTSGLTLAEYAEKKQLSVEFLRSCGLSEITYFGKPAVRMEYRGSNGELVAVRFRVAMTGDRFRWRKGDKVYPYGAWRLSEAKAKGYVTIGEGESDGHVLWFHGEPYLGSPGADTWQEAWADLLEGIANIYVVVEPDQGGEAVKKWL